MKALKRGFVPLLAMLILCLCAASASAGVVVQMDYRAIADEYKAAVTAETEEEALEHLQSLLWYYEQPGRAQALETYEGGSALVYYTYAKGMVAFEAQDYLEAWSQFSDLQGIQTPAILEDVPPLPDTTYYYEFSQAMLYWEFGEYESAFKALETARTAAGSSAKACKDAKDAFASALKQEAQACCDIGDHAQAQAYYKLYADYVSPFEGKSLLKKCEQHSQEIPLIISSAASPGPRAIHLAWTGSSASYRVSWTADLTGAVQPETQAVQGNSAELTGLLPGTVYQITVAPDGAEEKGVSATVTTQAAPEYKGKQETAWKSGPSILRRYERSFYAKTYTMYSLYDFITKLRPAPSDRAIHLSPIADGSSGYALVMNTNQPAEALTALKGKAYTVVLHLAGCGTVSSEGYLGDIRSALSGNVIAFALDDVLDQILDLYPIEGEADFTLDFLMEDTLIGTENGKVIAE